VLGARLAPDIDDGDVLTTRVITVPPVPSLPAPGVVPSAGVGPQQDSGSRTYRIPGLGAVAKGFGWGTSVQLVNVCGNLALTPFIIHGLGVERYGLFMMALVFMGMFSNLDGGAMGTAGRYFNVYAARDDRKETTRLLTTFCVMVIAVGLVISAAAWFTAPLVAGLLSMPKNLQPQAVFLFRTFGILAIAGFLHQVFQAVLSARQRYAWSSQSSLACYLLYVVAFVWVIRAHMGLEGVALVFVAQQVLASVLIVPAAMRYLDRRGIGLLSWSELKSVVSFSGKVQVKNIAQLVNNQVDPLVIGAGISVRALGFYNPGANFAYQLYTVAMNALGPANVYLGNSLGHGGLEYAQRQFVRLQRIWVRAVTGWSVVAMCSVYFGIAVWLGPRFHLAGWICAILTAGNAVLLVGALITTYAAAIGNAGVGARYGMVGMVVNIASTIPLVLLGSLGVVIGTAVGQVAAAAYLLRYARRSLGAGIPNPLREVPVGSAAITAMATVAMEYFLRHHVPSGPLGLLAMAVPAAIGLALFALLTVGPRRVGGYVSRPSRAVAKLRERIAAPAGA
jgi:O-antigen/teichoic acid export membrane protein